MADGPKPRKPRVEWTDAEQAEQVREVVEMISSAKTPAAIRAFLLEKYGIEEGTAQRRITAARQVLVQDQLGCNRHEKASELITMMSKVVEMSLQNGRCNDAIGAARLIAELTRLNKD